MIRAQLELDRNGAPFKVYQEAGGSLVEAGYHAARLVEQYRERGYCVRAHRHWWTIWNSANGVVMTIAITADDLSANERKDRAAYEFTRLLWSSRREG